MTTDREFHAVASAERDRRASRKSEWRRRSLDADQARDLRSLSRQRGHPCVDLDLRCGKGADREDLGAHRGRGGVVQRMADDVGEQQADDQGDRKQRPSKGESLELSVGGGHAATLSVHTGDLNLHWWRGGGRMSGCESPRPLRPLGH